MTQHGTVRRTASGDRATAPRTGLLVTLARWWRPALLVLLVTAGSAMLLVTGWPSVDGIREATAGAGWAAPVLFVLLFVAVTLVPAPATVMGIAAGVLFGLPLGLLTTMISVALGSLIGFAMSRSLGREVIAGLGSARIRRLDERIRRGGIWTIAAGRLLPLLPYPVLSYACGLTSVRTRDYLLGSVLGTLPSALAFATIGAYGGDPSSAPFLLAVAGMGAIAVAVVVTKRRRGGVDAGIAADPLSSPADVHDLRPTDTAHDPRPTGTAYGPRSTGAVHDLRPADTAPASGPSSPAP
ncbi:TVP38/TMEM64 family protein [Pseudonocardia phyllosphaerae]|uniref:TVP38/TMEM64 family protein n=1 Tax=Pseudonocardia phyllosphaerae TaxID=3390502 RepID=UPI00397B3BD4